MAGDARALLDLERELARRDEVDAQPGGEDHAARRAMRPASCSSCGRSASVRRSSAPSVAVAVRADRPRDRARRRGSCSCRPACGTRSGRRAASRATCSRAAAIGEPARALIAAVTAPASRAASSASDRRARRRRRARRAMQTPPRTRIEGGIERLARLRRGSSSPSRAAPRRAARRPRSRRARTCRSPSRRPARRPAPRRDGRCDGVGAGARPRWIAASARLGRDHLLHHPRRPVAQLGVARWCARLRSDPVRLMLVPSTAAGARWRHRPVPGVDGDDDAHQVAELGRRGSGVRPPRRPRRARRPRASRVIASVERQRSALALVEERRSRARP